ncbi:MAG: ATP synthase F0 subunit C [Clostridia bacterium]|nr:ATP synthase F0 subunit C [Clostridia bacterium]
MTFTIASLTSVFAADEDVAVLSAEEKTEQTEDSSKGTKAVAAAVVVAIAAGAGALGMAIAIGKSTESMARQPEAAGKINSAMMLGLVFIETAIIYALIVAILIIFVL